VRQGEISSPTPVQALGFSASGEVLAIAGEDATVRVARFRGASVLPGWSVTLDEPVATLALDADGDWLAGGYEGGGLFVRNLRSGEQRNAPAGHHGRVTGVAFNERADLLATGGEDQRVGLWRVPELSLVGDLGREHSGPGAISVVFNPVTGQLLSSGGDSVINLWPSAGEGDDAAPLPLIGHEKPAYALAFSPDGRRLLAGDGNRRVFLWEIDPGLWRERACALVNRNLTEDEWRSHVGTVPYQETCPASDAAGDAGRQPPSPRP
jgi:WD40 repeat protein